MITKITFIDYLIFFEDFEDALQSGTTNDQVLDFIREDLCEVYETLNCLREDIEKVSFPKNLMLKIKKCPEIKL